MYEGYQGTGWTEGSQSTPFQAIAVTMSRYSLQSARLESLKQHPDLVTDLQQLRRHREETLHELHKAL